MQEAPLSIRLWREVEEKVLDMARQMYHNNINATINLLLMRGLGCGDYEIETEAKKNMRTRNEAE